MTTELMAPLTSDSISLSEMDAVIKELKTAKEEYSLKKKESDNAYSIVKGLEAKIILMLEKSEKTVYIAEGVARVKVSHEMSVQTPKTPEAKLAFFKWIEDNMGEDVKNAYLTVNSQSLNSLYNQLSEEYASRGEILMIDGLEEPVARTSLSVTKA